MKPGLYFFEDYQGSEIFAVGDTQILADVLRAFAPTLWIGTLLH